jgi:glyoxylase-like metal-dependent hydrolase (beta-lactamase superfamily II)
VSTWRVGPVSVTRVEEQLGFAAQPPEKLIRGWDRAFVERHLGWLAPNHYSPGHDRIVSSVHSWLIRTERHTILLDCCAGNYKDRPWTPRFNMLETPFIERLHQAGARPEDIDIVLCTHLHADHVGWNTVLRDGRWVPTFPNARYLFSKTEAAYWDASQNPDMASDPRRMAYVDSVLPVVESGQAMAFDGSHAIDERMLIEPAPGHTPGHVIMKLDAGGERAVFCGDAIHHAIQVYAPHWNHAADEHPEEAARTRRTLLADCAERGALLFPTHFGAPHVVAIKAAAEAFALEFVDAARR